MTGDYFAGHGNNGVMMHVASWDYKIWYFSVMLSDPICGVVAVSVLFGQYEK
jgi:hypothetical protein